MKDLIDKLSSYNIFNYLLPGIVFVVFAEILTSFTFIQNDVILGVFFYYFLGLVISRIGSLVIEPLLKLTKFVRFIQYSEFLSAAKADPKIELLSETNNMYRTLCSLFLSLLLLKGYELLALFYPAVGKWHAVIAIALLLCLFGFSYRKQTAYITKRLRTLLEKGDTHG